MTQYHEKCSGCGIENKISFEIGWKEEWDDKGMCDTCKRVSNWELYCIAKPRGKKQLVSALVKKPATPKAKPQPKPAESGMQKKLAQLEKENTALGEKNASQRKQITSLKKEIQDLKKDIINKDRKLSQKSKPREPHPAAPAAKAKLEKRQTAATKTEGTTEKEQYRPRLDEKITYEEVVTHYQQAELKDFALENGFDAQCANKRFPTLAYDVWSFVRNAVRPLPREFIAPNVSNRKKKIVPVKNEGEEEEEEETEEKGARPDSKDGPTDDPKPKEPEDCKPREPEEKKQESPLQPENEASKNSAPAAEPSG
eukprot:TRINITY_DN4861_c3_g1_i2.p1 TRINITY_DN4861_c3_g1~~TRINITY_DN4861_c3_g1_i2.p1  ORF type:complete len:334 (+),score=72.06 TRINITY_DN4861_c3_g1_i2:68-1003(+)